MEPTEKKLYNLVNIYTGVKHACSKIEFKGLDYYVTDEDIQPKDKLFLLGDSLLGKYGDIITIVSTRWAHTEIIKANGDSHWFAAEVNFQKDWNYKKVIATNKKRLVNKLPQIVKEGEQLALQEYPEEVILWGINQFDDLNAEHRNIWKQGYNKRSQTHPFTLEHIYAAIKYGVVSSKHELSVEQRVQSFISQLPQQFIIVA